LTLPTIKALIMADRPVIDEEKLETQDVEITPEMVERVLTEDMVSSARLAAQSFSPEWNDAREFLAALLADLFGHADASTRTALVRLLQSD
jgi:hypothetical protein